MAKFSLDDADVRFFQGQAGKHAHEWEFYVRFDGTGAGARCRYPLCNKELSRQEVDRRLNAVEQLNAETAHAIWRKLDALSREHLGYEFSLIAYAAALEGADLDKLPTQQKLTEEDMNDNQPS